MRSLSQLTVISVVAAVIAQLPAAATPPAPAAGDDQPNVATNSAVSNDLPADKRREVLGNGWQTSADRAVTTAGDATGFHVLVADAKDGYQWRTAASLSEPGFDADTWIGNLCVTASGERAVVAYAPRTFTNKPDLAQRGAFTAIVDLAAGQVRKLPIQTSLAYFNPGCGPTESAVLTQEGTEDLHRTRLIGLDTISGNTVAPIDVPGQLTSPVPTASGIVAADSGAVVRVRPDGSRTVVAPAKGVPYQLAADADGGVVFAQQENARSASVHRVPVHPSGKGEVTTLATGALTELNVRSARGGQVFVTGRKSREASATPASVALANTPDARISIGGDLAVTSVTRSHTKDPTATTDPMAAQPVDITARSFATRKEFTLSVVPAAGAGNGAEPSPALSRWSGESSSAAGDPNDPADGDQRTCSVPRNDPRNQAMQPKPRQVEWAVDQAIRGTLYVQRPANWKNLGMPEYRPQDLFWPRDLAGGGYIPAQVMLGVLAQESNLWQGARFAVPGVTANPLIGNYFGINYYNDSEADDWTINWAKADCGYGVAQITDKMRRPGMGQETMPYENQRAVALDFAANIALGVQMLQEKWNETYWAGLIANDGGAQWIENWFFAVWAYNSGFHKESEAGANSGAWGVGWLNNPANPRYPANRTPFMDDSYEDAAHPQDWPYPEKVMGFAGHPLELIETPGNLVHGYRAAWWLTEEDRWHVKPGNFDFCNDSNNCRPGAEIVPDAPEVIGEPAGPCAHRNGAGKYDLKCWFHEPADWKVCGAGTCGNELLRFDPGYPYQEDATSYPPVCTTSGLPSNASVVDNLPQSIPSIRPDCTKPPSSGTFTFTFRAAANGTFPGKVDVHQLGASYGAHFWMSNTHRDAGREAVGTWRLNQARTGPMRIMVHLPDPGARTKSAAYRVNSTRGGRVRVIDQGSGTGTGNRWLNIGTYMFDNVVPTVSLSNLTADGDGTQRIAWDAVAFIPVSGQYHEETVESVAVFDEDQNIDTEPPGSWLAGPLANRQDLYDWATETTGGILGLGDCPPETVGDCLLPQTRRAISAWRNQVLAAGTHPTDHPDGTSMATWIGFANPYTDRPTTDQRPAHFNDDNRFKIRLAASVSFITDNGKVIAGSEYATYQHRTGNTHLPKFVRDFIEAIQSDYGIGRPNLTYRMPDLNAHDGVWRTADPLVTGVLPGRAYAYAGKAPVPVDPSGSPSQDNATCVAALTVAGGSIGYRPMLSQSGPVDAMEDWVSRIEDDPRTPAHLGDLAEEIREMFFDNGVLVGAESSVFTQAPPIWQELNFKACADGSIQKIQGLPLLRVSHMPDQYLYHNGRAMNLDGGFSGSSQPVMRGDFQSFSKLPDPNVEFPFPNPYGPCDFATGRSGNPWDITAIPPGDPGTNPPHAHFCLDKNLPADPSHSS